MLSRVVSKKKKNAADALQVFENFIKGPFVQGIRAERPLSLDYNIEILQKSLDSGMDAHDGLRVLAMYLPSTGSKFEASWEDKIEKMIHVLIKAGANPKDILYGVATPLPQQERKTSDLIGKLTVLTFLAKWVGDHIDNGCGRPTDGGTGIHGKPLKPSHNPKPPRKSHSDKQLRARKLSANVANVVALASKDNIASAFAKNAISKTEPLHTTINAALAASDAYGKARLSQN